MKAELIHIECGLFNGIANYKLGNKILRFELGTPNFNDYGEYRVNSEFEVLDYDDKYRGCTWKNQDIELSNEQANWWLNDNRESLGEYLSDCQMCGGKTEDGFSVFDKNNELIKFSEWQKLDHDPYEHFMLNVLNTFYHWYRSEDYKPVSSDVLIYPKL